MDFSAQQIAEWIEGEIVGSGDRCVSKLAKIEEADAASITFLGNMKYVEFLPSTKAGIVIVNDNIDFSPLPDTTYIKVKDAYGSFTKLLTFYYKFKEQKSGIEEGSHISSTAELGENVYVAATAYIGNRVKIGNGAKIYPQTFIGDDVTIGENTVINSGVKIYDQCVIGNDCIIHAGTVIGSDGFGFAPNPETGGYDKIPQIGNVIIKNRVEIGSCSTIDRATMGSTVIEEGVKLDNQIQIAHNVVIGKNTVIAAQTGVAGSTKIGENCVIGGQVGIVGHIKIGNRVQIQAQSGVNHDVADDEQVYGSPAMKAADFRKSYVYFRKLPKLAQTIHELEKILNKSS